MAEAQSNRHLVPVPEGRWPSRYVRSKKALAEWFDCSTSIIDEWLQLGAPGKTKRGYDIWHWGRWRYVYLRERAAGRLGVPKDETKAEQERIHTILKNHKALLELQVAQGKLISKEEALADFIQMANRVRGRLEAIPAEMVSSLPPELRADFLADATHRIRLVLQEIANWAEEV